MRITEQYLWHIVFSLFFLLLVGYGAVLLEAYAPRTLSSLSLFEWVVVALASFRMIRLVVYDKITAFFREQFYDAEADGMLLLPERGARRTLAELLSCPWCFGMWASALVLFCYLLAPYTHLIIYLLALSAVASFLQLFANAIGWKAEYLKRKSEQ